MAPKRAREQAPRHVNATKQTLPPDVITKRTKRHLEELERSNYTEPSITLDNDDEGVISGKNRVRQIVSDKRHLNDPSVKKKKIVHESSNRPPISQESCYPHRGIAHSKSSLPRSNLFNSHCSSPSIAPTSFMLRVRVQGRIQMQEMRHAIL
jgi:hypothetical protein